MEHGPFTRRFLRSLPARGWSLLVHDVNHFLPQGRALIDRFGFLGFADAIDEGHGADKDFPGGERGDDADAHFPVEAERGDGGFDEAAEAAGETLAEFGAGFFVVEGGEGIGGGLRVEGW